MAPLNQNIEIPLVRVLARMEDLGIGVDVDALRQLNTKLTAEVVRLSGVLQADTVITNTIVAGTYTPGAGNIW